MCSNESPQRAWRTVRLGELCEGHVDDIVGSLATGAARGGFDVARRQTEAWIGQLSVLREVAIGLVETDPASAEYAVALEYEIPRRSRRIDAVLLTRHSIIPIEFKVGADRFDRASVWQAEDYALDLRDFHRGSRGRRITPILVCTAAAASPDRLDTAVKCVGRDGLGDAITELIRAEDRNSSPLDTQAWLSSEYEPTPTVVEGATRLFRTHSVAELSRTYADNLGTTLRAIQLVIERAQAERRHVICFVTGVPGSGKTLTGLAAAAAVVGKCSASYFSGNGPLVRVLREAIAQDRAQQEGSLRAARRSSRDLVQDMHAFVKHYAVDARKEVPFEQVLVFDEAQRAWDSATLSKRHPSLNASEPSTVIEILERSPWAALIALVGEGQEIHRGEGGLAEWGRALAAARLPWSVFASPHALTDSEGLTDAIRMQRSDITQSPDMHLEVSIRSPRARHLNNWITAMLALDASAARREIAEVDGFRIGLTRDLEKARAWLRDASRDELRPGLVTSSGNARGRAYGIEADQAFLHRYPIEHWFLGERTDVRASWMLEVAMTEFKIQGLELDLIGACWGDDLTIGADGQWLHRRFAGTRWQAVNDERRRVYLRNKYRVLLSRGRDGMVIWVPRGSTEDPTRDAALLDRTAEHLQSCGIGSID